MNLLMFSVQVAMVTLLDLPFFFLKYLDISCCNCPSKKTYPIMCKQLQKKGNHE